MSDVQNARYQYEHYRYCYDNGHQEYLARAQQNFNYWQGKQWSDVDMAKLTAAGRPALTLNVIESLVRAMKGMQAALRNDVMYAPVQDASAESAKVMDAVWLHVQQMNMFDHRESDVYEKGLIMDRAYYDVRMDFSKSLQGDVKITSPRSQDIILDPSVDDYDPYTWPRVFKRRWVSYVDLVSMFGKARAEKFKFPSGSPAWFDYEDAFMSQQMGNLPYFAGIAPEDDRSVRGLMLLEQQYFDYKMKNVFVDVLTGDFSEVPESWSDEKIGRVLSLAPDTVVMKKEVKTVRWRVTCEDEVLHDEDSIYDRFTIVPFFPTFVDGVTLGAVTSLIDPQTMFNKVSSQELHIVNTTANSGWKIKQGSLKNMSIDEVEETGSRTGSVFELDDIAHMEKILPNQTPQGHDRLSFKADQIMRNLAGVSDGGRGFAREDVAGKAIIANQAAQDLNSAGWLSNLHRTKQYLVQNVTACVQTFMSEPRIIKINRGSIYNPDYQDVAINQHVEGQVLNDVTSGKYTTVLVPSPSRTTMSEHDFKMLMEMRKLGIGIPDAMLLELSPAANKAKIIQNLQGDSNERQAQAEEAAAAERAVALQGEAAKAQQAQAAATLSQARAEKAAVEAQTDPDAAYVQVETERLDIERQRMHNDYDLGLRDLSLKQQQARASTAVQLTKMDHDRETAKAVAKEKTAVAKKPGNSSKPKKGAK